MEVVVAAADTWKLVVVAQDDGEDKDNDAVAEMDDADEVPSHEDDVALQAPLLETPCPYLVA